MLKIYKCEILVDHFPPMLMSHVHSEETFGAEKIDRTMFWVKGITIPVQVS
jgi:hypothetical protein